MQSDFDKVVRKNDPKTKIAEHKKPKKQIFPAQKILDDCKKHYALQEKLYKKYGKSTTIWPNDMPLEDMERMVKFRCFSSRPKDAVAMKVMERLMAKDSAHKQVCTKQFTLFPSKRLSPHILVTESEAVGCEVAKLQQKLSKLP